MGQNKKVKYLVIQEGKNPYVNDFDWKAVKWRLQTNIIL